MFYPQSMTEIELIVPAKDMLAVTKTLAGQGVFNQIDTSYLSSDKLKPNESWQQQASTYTGLERRVLNLMQILDVDKGQPPPEEDMPVIDVDQARPIVEQIEAEVHKVTERRAEVQKKLEQHQNSLLQLEPLCDVNLDTSVLRDTRYVYSMLGTMPIANLERLQTSLARVPVVLLNLRQENHHAVVWMAGPQQNADVLERAARSAYLNPLKLPENYQGTIDEVRSSIQMEIEQYRQEMTEQEKAIAQLRETYQQQLRILFWRINGSRILADAIAHYGRLQHTYLIFGWVPTVRLPAITQRLKQASKAIVIETFPVRRGSSQDVPVSLASPRFLRPFQELVTTFAQPRYDEVDPTILMAITFPLLFGAMFGDLGQGLELALVGLLLSSRKIKALNSLAGLGRLITICGLAAAFFGILYGSVFGSEEILPALWIRPINNIMQILYISIGAGVVLLTLGFILGIINSWRQRNWGRLLFDHNGLSGLVLYWSLIGLVLRALLNLPIPLPLLILTTIVSAVGVAFSEIWKNMLERYRPLVVGGLATYAILVFFEMFETLISYLSNSLSYVRVGAFAVAHAGLSQVFFILGTLVSPGHGVGYWIMVIIGNIFIVGFEGLIVGIQTMRLEYYEFFSKFFTGGGVRAEPLSLRPSTDK